MSGWMRNWFENLHQTRRFHPSWIALTVLGTLALAAVVWGLAELLTRAEADDALPGVHAPAGHEAVQKGGAPATIKPVPVVPGEARQKTIQVRFLPPAATWERIPPDLAPAASTAHVRPPLRRVT